VVFKLAKIYEFLKKRTEAEIELESSILSLLECRRKFELENPNVKPAWERPTDILQRIARIHCDDKEILKMVMRLEQRITPSPES